MSVIESNPDGPAGGFVESLPAAALVRLRLV
jgi:hypothetical protein